MLSCRAFFIPFLHFYTSVPKKDDMRRFVLGSLLTFIFFILSISLTLANQESSLEQGIAQYQRENYDEALKLLQKAQDEDPVSTRAAYYLGLTYKKLQNYKAAKTHLRDAVTYTPKIKEALLELVDVLYQLGDLDGAHEWIQVAEEEGIRPAQVAFFKGLVLLKENKNLEAVDAFKKAKELDRALEQTADYQIGLAHLKQQSYPEAEKAFRQVIVLDPNTDISAYADQYAKAIERRREGEKLIRVSGGFYTEWDDNVILKPSDVTTVADIGNQEDFREVVTSSVEFSKRFRDFGIKLDYDLYFANQDGIGIFDLHSHTWGVTPAYYSKSFTLSAPLQYNHTWVDESGFISTFSANPLVNLKIGERQLGQVGVKFQVKNYLRSPVNENEDRDAFRVAPGLGWFFFFPKNKGFFGLRYELDVEDADGRNWNYFGNRANASLQLALIGKLKVTVVGDFYFQDFLDRHTTFGVKRDDDAYTLSTLLTYPLWKNSELQLRYTFVSHDSNIALYEYDRNVFSTGVVYNL